MKLRSISILFLLVLEKNALCQNNLFRVTGFLKMPQANGTAKLITSIKTDSTKINRGYFEFSGNSEEYERATLSLKLNGSDKKIQIPIILTGENMELDVSQDEITVKRGELLTSYYYKIAKPVQDFNAKIKELRSKNSTAKFNRSPDSLTITQKLFDTIDSCFNVPIKFIKENPKSPLSITALYYMGQGKKTGRIITLPDLEALYNGLEDQVKASSYGKKYLVDLKRWIASSTGR